MRTIRSEFDQQTRDAAWLRCEEHCEVCCQPFGDRRPEYHHRIEASMGGDNSLRNCVVVCPPCHRLITKERAPVIAKVKRIERKRANLKTKKYDWPKQSMRRYQ